MRGCQRGRFLDKPSVSFGAERTFPLRAVELNLLLGYFLCIGCSGEVSDLYRQFDDKDKRVF